MIAPGDWVAWLRVLHVSAVSASIALFAGRSLASLRGRPWPRRGWIGIAPHMVDTVLLVSAVCLIVVLRQYPFAAAWVTAKLIGLMVYIALGAVAMQSHLARWIRALCLGAAALVAVYMALTALHHDPNPGHWFSSCVDYPTGAPP